MRPTRCPPYQGNPVTARMRTIGSSRSSCSGVRTNANDAPTTKISASGRQAAAQADFQPIPVPFMPPQRRRPIPVTTQPLQRETVDYASVREQAQDGSSKIRVAPLRFLHYGDDHFSKV